jgi:hypothetical protein
MPYCHGCGCYTGDYSAYLEEIPGKGKIVLCYRCKKWSERHPGQSAFPSRNTYFQTQGKRIRTFAAIYIIGSFSLFALGITLIVTSGRFTGGTLLLLGGMSLLFIGFGMKRFSEK